MWWASHIIFVSVQKLSSSSSQRRKAIGCLCSGISLLLHLVIITVVHNANNHTCSEYIPLPRTAAAIV